MFLRLCWSSSGKYLILCPSCPCVFTLALLFPGPVSAPNTGRLTPSNTQEESVNNPPLIQVIQEEEEDEKIFAS